MFAPKEPLSPVAIQIQERPLEVEEIDDNFLAKKVKWGENTEHVYKENGGTLESSIAQILEMLGTLSKKVDEQGELIRTLLQKPENI
jgi:hypothetical protein